MPDVPQRQPRTHSARFIAAGMLRRFNPRRDSIAERFGLHLKHTDQGQRCTDLVLGTLRHQTALDRVIEHFAGCPVKRIVKTLRPMIRVAVYELVFCVQTPVYSIVNEAAANARILSGAKQVGFVNAVLRQVSRHIKCRCTEHPFRNPRATLFLDGDHGCEFDQVFLPDPRQHRVEYFCQCFSLPSWLIKRWLEAFDHAATMDICLGSTRRPSVYLRPNPMKTSVQALSECLCQAGLALQVCEEGLIRLSGAGDIGKLPGFDRGWFSVQDLAAFQVGRMIGPSANLRILDMCAAPGGKVTHLAELTRNRAAITATDINGERLRRVAENTGRLGLEGIEIIDYESIPAHVRDNGPFDLILLDVPCSNTGVLARRVEARYRCSPRVLEACAQTQVQLMQRAAPMVKPGGRICYSTCSILRAENQDRVAHFLARERHFRLEQEKLTLPTARLPDSDGGYAAILRKGYQKRPW